MEDFKSTLKGYEPELSNVLVPNCIYRFGCPEFKTCGYLHKFMKWAKDNGKDIDWTDIQARYDLYNEYFYSNRKDD